MNESKFFGLITDNDIIYDFDFMQLTDYCEIKFLDMKLCYGEGDNDLYLLYDLSGLNYNSYTEDINHIKEKWNTKAKKCINMFKLMEKL